MAIASIGFGVAAIYTIGSRKSKSKSAPAPSGWAQYRACFSDIVASSPESFRDKEADAIVNAQETIRKWAKQRDLDENYLNAIAWLQSRMGTVPAKPGLVGMFAVPQNLVRNLLNQEGLQSMDVATAAVPDVNTRIASLLLSKEMAAYNDPYLAYLSFIAGREYADDVVASAQGDNWIAQIENGSVLERIKGLEKTWADFVSAEQKAAEGRC